MSQAATPWEVGHESGRQVVTLGIALTLTAIGIDILLNGELTQFFDLGFIALCLLLAVMVRHGDFFVVALLPPLLMLLTFALVALVAPDALAKADDSVVQAVVSGVAHHAVALFAGYALCLGWLGWRLRSESDLATELGSEWDSHLEA